MVPICLPILSNQPIFANAFNLVFFKFFEDLSMNNRHFKIKKINGDGKIFVKLMSIQNSEL